MRHEHKIIANTNLPRVWPFGPTRRGETYIAPFGAPLSSSSTHSLSRWDYAMGYTYTAPVGAQDKIKVRH